MSSDLCARFTKQYDTTNTDFTEYTSSFRDPVPTENVYLMIILIPTDNFDFQKTIATISEVEISKTATQIWIEFW